MFVILFYRDPRDKFARGRPINGASARIAGYINRDKFYVRVTALAGNRNERINLPLSVSSRRSPGATEIPSSRIDERHLPLGVVFSR